MPADTSLAFRQAAFAAYTNQEFILLLTINHSSFGSPIRLVQSLKNVTSRGNLYAASIFTIALPEQNPEQMPSVTLRIQNVDLALVQGLRTIATPLLVTLELVLGSAPDTLEAGPFDFTLRAVEYDLHWITGRLQFEDLLNERFPAQSYTPALFPAAF